MNKETVFVLRYQDGRYFKFDHKGDFGYSSWISSAEYYSTKDKAEVVAPAIEKWSQQKVEVVKVNFIEEVVS